MAMAIDEKSLPKLREYLASRGFTDKYFQLSQLINKFDGVADIKQNLSVLKTLYDDFLSEYPFNHTYWTKYAGFYTKIQEKEAALQIFEEAVSLNPTSPDLWFSFIGFVTEQYNDNSEKINDVYERAIRSVDFDTNSHVIWNSYLTYLEAADPEKAHAAYWRLLEHPVSHPNEIYQRYEKFVTDLDPLQYQAFFQERKDLAIPVEALANKVTVQQIYAQKLQDSARVNVLADSERKLQSLLEKTEYDGEDLDLPKEEALQSYLAQQDKVLSLEKLIYLYRKCLVVKCKSGEFWVKLLHLMEKSSSPSNQLTEVFRRYKNHFNIIENKEKVFFFEADLKEANRDVEGCREIYASLEQKKIFEAYLRHIYMEIRTNNIQSVIEIFVSLSQSVQDGDQIAFVVQEMGDILNKLGEVDRAVEIIRQFNEKSSGYSKFFYISWINFLKNCKKPWEEIEAVFKLAFEKIKENTDKEALRKVFVYTARSYCNDIQILRDIERRCALREDIGGQTGENGINAKRSFDNLGNTNDEGLYDTRKQLKTD